MNTKKGKIKVGILSAITAILLAAVFAVNIVAVSVFDGLATTYFGTIGGDSGKAESGTNLFYAKDYASAAELYEAATDLGIQMAQEGVVLLKNEDNLLPLGKGGSVSLFGTASVNLVCGGSGSGAGTPELNTNLKTAFEAAGISVNETLWKFYAEGNGSGDAYGIGAGTIEFGRDFDWSINEVPASVLQAEPGLSDTFTGTTAIYVVSRTGGEDGDPSRDMAAYQGARGQHYLELDADERGVLGYLSENFGDIVVILNANNPLELDFLAE